MADNKKFKQFVLDELNETVDVIAELSKDNTIVVYQFGIQGPYGTEFKLNNTDAIIGPSGVFEFSNIIPIESLTVTASVEGKGRVIVDVLYV